nr:hypothetical protein [Nanoarchaeum sp.]
MVIYKIKENSNKEIESIYKKALKQLEKFYGFKLEREPNIIVIKDREQLKTLVREGADWIKGFSFSYLNSIFILNKKSLTKSKRISKKTDYEGLIKHELSHQFYHQLSSKSIPAWLSEGTALYTDGRLKYQKEPEIFTNFLNFEKNEVGKEVYKESGFAVEFLVNKFGKQKLLELIKECKNIKSPQEFKDKFEKIYKFEMNYENFNKLYKG